MRKIIAVFFALLSITSCAPVQDNERQTNINSIFDQMELQGVDTKKPLLYGYFFYDQDQSKLAELKDELLKDKYKLVRLEKAEDQEFILHVEKVEIHSRASLLEREIELDQPRIHFGGKGHIQVTGIQGECARSRCDIRRPERLDPRNHTQAGHFPLVSGLN
jgi:hypothetical protein